MENIDVPKIIEAAATSNLGVLSLLVLVLAFLAWRFFQKSGDKVKLVAFGLMFLGAFGFGASVMMAGPTGAAAEAVAKPNASPAPDPTPPVPEANLAPAATSPSPQGIGDISGAWRDSDGYRYAVQQNAAAFSYISTLDGQRTSSGEGTITGNRLNYKYRNEATADSGTCTGRLAADAKAIDGKCGNGMAEWGFHLER
ncbi:hypothetical protein [Sphingomonas psychrotolerans]|uniref:Uncharacterized protein n=1 Tax=Sphingomonas psychrotolerans TaxID=1327635 RepID=A0A2K8MKN9_9SPHN|nr:hypothetical protein [Sphingomonas psychrotolerans]ATY31761.1 hypothetical protein CVN68_07090 [Sphingomonas psychrotolerans]